MKLGLKIILPIFVLLVIILGSFGYLLYSLKQQEIVISGETLNIQKLNGLNERLSRQNERTEINVLAYRFNQDRTLLLAITQTELDKSKTLDEMSPFITTPRGRGLVTSYIESRKEVESLRNQLVQAIDEGNKERIGVSYNKWSIQTQNIKAALSDIEAYNINSLEKTLVTFKDIRNQITQVIIILAFVVAVTILLLYFYLRVIITTPITRLAALADQLAKADFTTTTTTTTTRKDELGVLSRAINTMAVKLKESYGSLEQEVEEKTAELSRKVLNLEDTKKATLNILEDLEEEKNKEESLVKDLEKFKLALDNTSEQVVITNPEGIIIYVNRAVEKITGYKSEEAVGKKSGVLWKKPMPPEYYQKMWDTIKKQKKVFIDEIQNKRKNGEVYTAAISISPIFDKTGEIIYFVGVERDITREKEIDKAKTEFASLASHQLRTPLSTINWYLELMLTEDKGKLNDDQKEYAQEAILASHRMVALVNSLLNVSRIEMGTFAVTPELVNIAGVIKACVSEFGHKIQENKLSVQESYDPNVPKVMADSKLLGIVCQNLVENAVNYTPSGGKIEVSLKNKGSDILISVADNGIGIPKAQQEAIFTKLFRADNAREKKSDGNGLGLYMTKSIIEHAGGKIWFSSKGGSASGGESGTTFYVSIPLSGMKAIQGTKELSKV